MKERSELINLIENLSDILSVLVELKKKGKFQEALNRVDQTLIDYFKFDSSFLLSLSEELLVDVLIENKGLDRTQLSTLADLLNEQGEILLEQNNLNVSKKVLKNTLTIYYFLNEDQDFFSFRTMNKMVLINEKLSSINMKINGD